QVVVPPGVDTGINLRLSNQGDAGERGGPPGHLFIHIRVNDDPFFTRDGSNVHVTVPITLSQAVLGATLTVPTVRGEVELKVPAGTQPDDRLIMRGRGIKSLNNSRGAGDQYVSFKIVVPKKLSGKQEELMREFAKEGGESATGEGEHSRFLRDTIERIKKYVSHKA
ncbi:molecular chaperone DnaJ, partial [archaeon]